MKASLKFWTVLLCAGLVIGGCCDDPIEPEIPSTGDDNPPVEQPEKPLTDGSLFTVQLNEDIMATVGTDAWNAITYTGGEYIAIGDNGSVATSQNGDTWSTKKAGSSNWKSFGEFGDYKLILGENGMVALTDDLVPHQLGTNKWNASEYFSQNQTSIQYFIVGNNGAIYRDLTPTLDVSKVATFGTSDWKGVKMVKQNTGSKYVAIVVGTEGYIGTLYKMNEWSQERVGTSDWNGIFSCNFSVISSLIAFGNNGIVAKSDTQGQSWTTVNVGSVNWNAAITYPRGFYSGAALFGNNGYIATSANGSNWSTIKADNLNCNWVKCEYIKSDKIILVLSAPDSTGNVYMAISKYPFEKWSAQKLSAKNLNCFYVMQ